MLSSVFSVSFQRCNVIKKAKVQKQAKSIRKEMDLYADAIVKEENPDIRRFLGSKLNSLQLKLTELKKDYADVYRDAAEGIAKIFKYA